jgi:hypothetical protein
MRRAAGSGSEDHFSCIKKAWCTAELDSGYVLTVIENAAYLGPACDTADIVVTAANQDPFFLPAKACANRVLLKCASTKYTRNHCLQSARSSVDAPSRLRLA